MPKSGMQCYVSGKVQGVWYRANTKEQAEKYGITGYAKNLPDGRVEVLAYGDEAALNELHTWLKQGPPKSKVADVTREPAEWQECTGFEVL